MLRESDELGAHILLCEGVCGSHFSSSCQSRRLTCGLNMESEIVSEALLITTEQCRNLDCTVLIFPVAPSVKDHYQLWHITVIMFI